MDPVELENDLKRDRSTGKQSGEFVFTKALADIAVSAAECKKLCEKIGFKYEEGYESRIIQYKFTDATIDRYGDKIIAKGVKLDKYRSNPIVLAFHNSYRFPIGQTIKVWYDKASDSIKGWVLFLDNRVDDSGFADSVFKMAKSGVIKTGSIGFIPVAGKARRPDEKEKAAGMNEWSYVFEEIELLEYSIVPLPANPSSMAEPITKGFFSRKQLEKMKMGKPFENEEMKTFEDMIDKAIKDIEGAANMDPEIETPAVIPGTVLESKARASITLNFQGPLSVEGMDNLIKKIEEYKERGIDVTANIGNTPAENTSLPETYVKALADLMDQKAGAVLSKKNKGIVKDALSALSTVSKAAEALQALLKAAGEEDEVEEDDDEDEEDKNKNKNTGKGKDKSHKGSQNGDPVGGNPDPYGADFLGKLDKGIKALEESA